MFSSPPTQRPRLECASLGPPRNSWSLYAPDPSSSSWPGPFMASRSLGIRIVRPTRIGGRRDTRSWHRPRTRVSDVETLRSSVPTPERSDALGRDSRGPDGAPMAPDVSTPRLAWAPNPCVWIRLCRRTELCLQPLPPRLIETCFASVAPPALCRERGDTGQAAYAREGHTDWSGTLASRP